MPSPFPGMDPFLEDPAVWPGFHLMLMAETVRYLQPILNSRGYFAVPGSRVWLGEAERAIYPDVGLFEPQREPPTGTGSASSALLDIPVRVRKQVEEHREVYVEIVGQSDRRLVTCIELISPSNKRDPTGRELYSRKQRDTRDAGVHLVEIDLLRSGPRIVDLPGAVLSGVPKASYLVNIVRRGADEYEFFPVSLRSRLPRIGVPLKVGENDARLDLQEVFDQTYDEGGFARQVDYSKTPGGEISPDDLTWLRACAEARS